MENKLKNISVEFIPTDDMSFLSKTSQSDTDRQINLSLPNDKESRERNAPN